MPRGPIAACAVVAACGTEQGDPGPERRRPPGPGEVVCEQGGALDLTGRFAALATLNVRIESAYEIPPQTGHILILADLDQQGTDVGVHAQLCDLDIPPVQLEGAKRPMALHMGEDLLRATRPERVTATLSGERSCAEFAGTTLRSVVGAALSDPRAPLPDAPCADSPPGACHCEQGAPEGCAVTAGADCLCDQDWDGRPGATVTVTGLIGFDHDGEPDEFFVALRVAYRLLGVAVSSDRIEGQVTTDPEDRLLDQVVAGCVVDGDLCSEGLVSAIRSLAPRIEQQPDNHSTFLALRVDGDMDCATLRDLRHALFR